MPPSTTSPPTKSSTDVLKLHDLSPLIVYRPLRVFKDGRPTPGSSTSVGYNSAFLVEVMKAGRSSRYKKVQCVLKMAHKPPGKGHMHETLHRQEIAANTLLNKPYSASLSALELTYEAIFTQAAKALSKKQQPDTTRLRYPRCFGRLQVPEAPIWDAVDGSGSVRPDTDAETVCPGLLFEYIPDLELLATADVTPAIAAETQRVLATIHACNVRHNDLQNMRVFPDIGFFNIFLQKGTGYIYILDFNCAKTVGDTPEGQALLKEEADNLAEIFDIVLSGRDPRKGLPREVLRLMS